MPLMLAKVVGADNLLLLQLVLLLPIAAVSAFGGGALLMVGGKYIAKSSRAGYWRSVGAIILSGLVGVVIIVGTIAAVRLLSIGRESRQIMAIGWLAALFLGFVGGLVLTWLIIKAMFRISFGKAILAWLPTLGTSILTVPLLLAMLLPAMASANRKAQVDVCRTHLHGIGRGATAYSCDYNGLWPENLQALSPTYVVSPEVFKCPCAKHTRPAGRTVDYFYLRPEFAATGNTIVACDYAENHPDGTRCVLFLNGSIRLMSEDEFQRELGDPDNASFAEALDQAE